MASSGVTQRVAAILAADAVGYTRLMADDETATIDALDAARAVFAEHVAVNRGRIVDTAGDSILAVFDATEGAVRAAIAIQERFAEINDPIPETRRMQFRIGLHLGDIREKSDGTIYGDGVNVAARLEGIAEPGSIIVSDSVQSALRSRLGLIFADAGSHIVKNVAEPLRAFRIGPPGTLIAADVAKQSNKSLIESSIVVLPFTNMSNDPEQEYFSDGITEDIITDLSKLSGLLVIARNSAFVYKGQSFNVSKVCAELGVRFALEGSIRKAGNRVRVNAQLIEAERGGHLWAERYDRDLTDIFTVQDDVTAHIVEALAVALGQGEKRRLGQKGTKNIAAYDLLLRGRELFLSGSYEDNRRAKQMLQEAIEIDPGCGPAYAFLSQLHAMDYVNGWSDDPEASLRTACEMGRCGVEATPDDAHAHVAYGSTFLWMKRHDEAIAEAECAVRLDPNYAYGLFELGWYLQYAGRPTEALDCFDRAIRLDPHHASQFLHFMAQAHFQLNSYEEAIELLLRRLAQTPRSDSSRMLLAASYGHLGREQEARATWEELKAINPGFSLEQRRAVLPYKNPQDFNQIVSGLRKAGVKG